jgi:hypothetical protein
MKKGSTKSGELYELEDMKIDEVSVVDRPANGVPFLLLKSDDSDEIDLTDLAAQPRRKVRRGTMKAKKTDTVVEPVVVEAPVEPPAVEPVVAPVAEAEAVKTEEPAPVAAEPVVDAAPVVEPVVAPVEAAAVKTEEPAPVVAPETVVEPAPVAEPAAAPAVATETVKTTEEPAPVAVVEPMVETAPVAAVEPPKVEEPTTKEVDTSLVIPTAVKSRAQAAWLAGLDAIGERLDFIREAVKGSEPDSITGSYSETWPVWSHTEYLKRMIDALCCIGGPAWDVTAAAATAVAGTEKGVEKVGRAISGTRMRYLKEVHGRMTEAMKMLEEIFAETDDAEAEKALEKSRTDATDAVAKATETVVVKALESAKSDIKATVIEELTKAAAVTATVLSAVEAATGKIEKSAEAAAQAGAKIEKSSEVVGGFTKALTSLTDICSTQSELLEKAVTNANSNALVDDTSARRGNVDWTGDLAGKRDGKGRRF